MVVREASCRGFKAKRVHISMYSCLISLSICAFLTNAPGVNCFLSQHFHFVESRVKLASSTKAPLLRKATDKHHVSSRPEYESTDDNSNENNGKRKLQGGKTSGNKPNESALRKQKREKDRNFSAKRRSKLSSLRSNNSSNKRKLTSLKALLRPETDNTLSSLLDDNEEEAATEKSSTHMDVLMVQPQNSSVTAPPVCRIVTLSDGKIPTSQESLPKELFRAPHVLRKLDDIYHAMSHVETRQLQYMDKKNKTASNALLDQKEEGKLVSVVRNSLEDAGFQLLTRRDLDLCDALNEGYLLRLSIVPNVKQLDPGISKEFYPERFDENGTLRKKDDLPFDGNVLVFWRGYSQEVTNGRLLLPKLDYLQASIVQRAAAWVRRQLGSVEQAVSDRVNGGMRKVTAATLHSARAVVDRVPDQPLSRALRTSLRATTEDIHDASARSRRDTFFKLARYGGSKIKFVGSPDPNDSLDPFMICEDKDACDIQQLDESMYDCLNHNNLQCPYDAKKSESNAPVTPMQLLERVTISTLVDPFSKAGRKGLLNSFVAKSELKEPTYEEVVVVWRQKEDESERLKRPMWTPPKIAYELADMFDYDGLPEPEDPNKPKPKMPLQIRTFDDVPMANLPAVMPKTKLVFRPADAFVFDLISLVSLGLAVGSQRFNSARLDLLALGAVSLWCVRLLIRYSNKLARYDLLVKKFLTSKISHRNSGALKYLVAEAGQQRAARAALVHTWLARQEERELDRTNVLNQGLMEINDLVQGKQVHVDVGAALNDLEDIGLVQYDHDKIKVAHDHFSIGRRIRRAWNAVLDEKISMSKIVGRRDH